MAGVEHRGAADRFSERARHLREGVDESGSARRATGSNCSSEAPAARAFARMARYAGRTRTAAAPRGRSPAQPPAPGRPGETLGAPVVVLWGQGYFTLETSSAATRTYDYYAFTAPSPSASWQPT